MKSHRWIVLLAVSGLVLGACTTPAGEQVVVTEMCEECPTPDPTPTPASCDPGEVSGEATERYRAWVLFSVEYPREAAGEVRSLLTEGGDAFVIVRADVVEGDYNNGDFNLVIPVDAADDEAFNEVLADLKGKVGSDPSVLHVTEHFPLPPHCSHTFVAEGEFEMFPLGEYYPPGRHPQSPGANPWG